MILDQKSVRMSWIHMVEIHKKDMHEKVGSRVFPRHEKFTFLHRSKKTQTVALVRWKGMSVQMERMFDC